MELCIDNKVCCGVKRPQRRDGITISKVTAGTEFNDGKIWTENVDRRRGSSR